MARIRREDAAAPEPTPRARPAKVPVYVIHTSGSTGVPKGVAVAGSAVIDLFRSCSDGPFTFGPEDTWSLYFSYSFDFTVWEIWGALLFGGRIAVVPVETAKRPPPCLSSSPSSG